MNKLILAIVLVIFTFGCKKNSVDPSVAKTTKELITQNAWKLDRYTDTSGKTISNSSLNVSALLLFGLNFEFGSDNVTKAVDRVTKSIINKGTWALLQTDTVMDINIDAFKGQFKIISISTGKLTLQAPTGSFLSGLGDTVNLEFTAAQ